MTPEIDALLRSDQTAKAIESPVVIYGAGSTGRSVCDYLTAAGYTVAAILDANAKPGQSWNGREIKRPAEWAAKAKPSLYTAVIAIHNYAADMVSATRDVEALGFPRVLNMVDFHNIFPNDQPFRYWLAPRSYYHPFVENLSQVHSLLADQRSREWYESTIAFRLTGEYARLPVPSTLDQYRPKDLPRWKDPMNLVDCGAYDGDTVEQFAKRDHFEFESIVAFEPDPDNFARLASRLSGYTCPTVCFPCGVSHSTSLVQFEGGNGMASRSVATGGTAIQCVSLDEAIYGFKPSLIKMDIEGAETDALLGGEKLIAKSRPSLAISLYHRPSHIWQIPMLLKQWDLGYRFFIRGHANNTFELVLYALNEH